MYDSQEIQRLWNSIKWSYRQLEPHRRFRAQLIKEYAGTNYGESETCKQNRESLYNVWALTIDTMSLAISGGTPQVELFTDRDELLPFAAKFSAVMNVQLQK